MSLPGAGRAQRWQRALESFVFGHRLLALLVTPALLLLLAVTALRVPAADPVVVNLPAVAPELRMAALDRSAFGSANLLRLALVRRDGEVFDTAFLVHLARLTETLARVPGIGAGRVHSLFSADARFIDVVDARYYATAIAPPALREAATPELIAKLRANLVKAQALGRWVSGDGRGALIEIEPAAGAATPTPALLRQLAAEELALPVPGATTGRIEILVAGAAVEMDGARQRLMRSLPAVLLALAVLGVVLRTVLGHGASLLAAGVAVLPAFGALAAGRLLGVAAEWPVLFASFVLSLAMNLRLVVAWLVRAAAGSPGFDASLAAWRSLAGRAVPAVLAAMAAFAALALLPFPALQAPAAALCVGATFALLGERLLLPVLLSRVRVADPLCLSRRLSRRTALAVPLARAYVACSRPEAVLVLLTAAATLFGWSLWQRQSPWIEAGGATEPAARQIARAFPLAVNRLWIGAESEAWSCAQPQTLDQVDRLAWKLDNTRGVLATQTMPGVVRRIHTAFAEGAPKFAVLPRRRDMLIQAIAPLAPELRLGSADCSTLPIWVATDGRAETLARVAVTVADFERDNAADFFAAHRQFDPAACTPSAGPPRPTAGAGVAPAAEAKPVACPVHFALGGGPLGEVAAQARVLAAAAGWMVWAALAAALLVLRWALGRWTAAAATLLATVVIAPFVEAALAVRGVTLDFSTLPLAVLAVGLGAAFATPIWQEMAGSRPARDDADAVPEAIVALAVTALALGGAALVLLSPPAVLDLASRWFWFALFGVLAAELLLLPVAARLALAERDQSSAAPSGRRN